MKKYKIIPFGCGVNSVAMLIEMVRREDRPDFILFANTGGHTNLGEKYETYRYKRFFSNWLKSKGFPEIKTVVTNPEGLYQELIRLKNLPSIAFDWKSCSQKWKIRAQDNWIKKNLAGAHITKYIGYDAGESHRNYRNYDTENTTIKYPLVEWGLDRWDCVQIIIDSGLPSPPKSSCFFCPNMRHKEIIDLKEKDACRFDLAIKLEKVWQRSGKATKRVQGLARKHQWKDLVKIPVIDFDYEDDYLRLDEMPCSCSI